MFKFFKQIEGRYQHILIINYRNVFNIYFQTVLYINLDREICDTHP